MGLGVVSGLPCASERESEVVGGVGEADVLDESPEQIAVVREHPAPHFVPEQVAQLLPEYSCRE